MKRLFRLRGMTIGGLSAGAASAGGAHDAAGAALPAWTPLAAAAAFATDPALAAAAALAAPADAGHDGHDGLARLLAALPGLAGERREDELPLVVVRGALVEPNRRVGGLAGHPDHAPAGAGRAAGLAWPAGGRTPLRAAGRPAATAWRGWGTAPPGPRAAGDLRGEEDLELAIRGHRVLVLLAQEPLLDEQVDVRRERAGELALEEGDGARVLLAPEHQLGFLLAGRLVPPDRHGERHQHAHDGDAHEQRGHRVAFVGPPPAVLTR